MKLIELTYSAEKLEALSDKDLEASFAKFYPITRPEQAKKEQHKSAGQILSAVDAEAAARRKRGIEIARAFGIKL